MSVSLVDEIKRSEEELANVQSIMKDFDPEEWESYRKAKGPWTKDFHKAYRNYSMNDLMDQKKCLMDQKKCLMEKENIELQLLLKEKGQ
jgi:hypothetical protein